MLFSLLFCALGWAATVNVPGDQPTIQAGISAASHNDTVLVGPGIYDETISFQSKQIVLRSSHGPLGTILTNTHDSYVIAIHTSGNSSVEVTGFTIRGAETGVWCQNTSPTIRRNVFVDCFSGIRASGAGSTQPATVISNTFINCSTAGVDIAYDISGEVRNNIFSGGVTVEFPSNKAEPLLRYNCFYNTVSLNGYSDTTGSHTLVANPLLHETYLTTPASPCIDAGDPDPQFNDPDGTRANIGAFYQFCEAFDSDGDGDNDCVDNCIYIVNPNQSDADADGVGNVCDACPGFDDNLDADQDGIADGCDACPGFNDYADFDGDSVADSCDNCPTAMNANQFDSDGDSVGDACDACPGFDDLSDVDNDGMADGCDICPLDSLNDADGDGLCESDDNCPATSNPSQIDSDGDGVGDLCDICPGFNDSEDLDNDGIPNGCDVWENCDQEDDLDSDAIPDACDNCPTIVNPDQIDSDMDGRGDACMDCCEVPGDANHSGQSNIGDITFIINTIFDGGPYPYCPEEGDPSLDGKVNIHDVVILLARIFSGGPPLQCGPFQGGPG